MLKALIKLPFKVALLPLKIALKAAGILRDDEPGRPTPPPRPSNYQPPPEPEVPTDLEVQAKVLVERVAAGEEIVFVDVRGSAEIAASGKIEGALHIPMQDLARRYEELGKDTEIVLYCAAGQRSYGAAMFLREKGYDRAHSMILGLPGWQALGGEVVSM